MEKLSVAKKTGGLWSSSGRSVVLERDEGSNDLALYHERPAPIVKTSILLIRKCPEGNFVLQSAFFFDAIVTKSRHAPEPTRPQRNGTF